MGAQNNVIIAYGNLVTPLVTATASQSQTLSPAAYALVDFRGPKWLSTNLTSVTYTVDLGTAQTVTLSALLDTNLTSSGTVALYGSTDNFVTSNMLVIPAGPLVGNPGIQICDASTYRYWQWQFSDPTNPAGYIQVGRFWLSQFLQPTDNYAMNWIDGQEDLSVKTTALNGVEHIDVKPTRWINKLKFEKVLQDDRDGVLTFQDNVGNHAPFICALDVDNYPLKTHWVRFKKALALPAESDWHVYDYEFDLQEGV